MSRGGDFWSRRRAQVAAEEAQEARAAEEAALAEARAEAEEKTDAEILAEFDLPDPDSLKMGDDVTGFLNRAVPERLRRRALRRLWRLNPVLANLDGLNDYDGDYTNAATDRPGVKTAYQVGKGLLRHVEAQQKQALGPKTAETTPEEPDNPAEITQENQPSAPASTTKVAMVEAGSDVENDNAEPMPALPRRMRFRFEESE